MEDKNNLDELKQKYNEFRKKYNLPEFLDMNKVFDVEEIDIETDFLLRKIRRVVSERISGYLRFIEVILNPSNAPIFIFKLIKKINEEDKKQLIEIYEILGNFEIEIIKLDLAYDEIKEAEFIKKVYNILNDEISKKLLIIIEKMRNGKGSEKKVGRESYFGWFFNSLTSISKLATGILILLFFKTVGLISPIIPADWLLIKILPVLPVIKLGFSVSFIS